MGRTEETNDTGYPVIPGGSRRIEILLVEDNPGDVHLTLEAFKDARIENTVHVVSDGEDALRFLRREDGHGDAPRPDLVLLDLNLPRKNGHEVLAEIRADPAINRLPVVVLTSSDRDSDVDASYGLNANCYITKPISVDDFTTVVRSISDFWFRIVRLPD